MKQFTMQGKAITGFMRFREFFSPGDLLRQRELAAGFLYQHFRFLSDVMLYHTEMFYQTVFLWTDEMRMGSPEDYCRAYWAEIEIPGFRKKDWVYERLQQPKRVCSRSVLWQTAQGTDLPEADRSRLFCLLEAGYALAGKTPEDCPITPEQAKDAYLRHVRPRNVPGGQWLDFPESGDIYLNAREEPYRILLCRDPGILTQGHTITCRKLIAMPHVQGSVSIPVRLSVCLSPEDPKPREIRFYPGDYRYGNFVGNRPVFFHPVSVETPVCKMERRGAKLRFRDKYGKYQKFDCPSGDQEIIAFAPEQADSGWILLLRNLSVEDTFYTHRMTDGYRMPKEHIVQAAFRGTECLLLDDKGFVHSNQYGTSSEKVTSLEEFQRQKRSNR